MTLASDLTSPSTEPSVIVVTEGGRQHEASSDDNESSSWNGLVSPAEGGVWPRPVPQRSIAEERLHRRRKLAGAYRIFAKLGLAEGLSGHITARDPELPDHFWVNRFGLDFSRITVSNLLLVNSQGEIVEGQPPLNTSAFAIHSRIHAARPDVIGAAHTHSPYGRALAALGEPLHPISQDVCSFYQHQAVFGEYNGAVVTQDEGQKIADALGPHKLVILRNHGLLTVGASVEAAAYRFIAAERAAHTQLVAAAAGPLRLLDHRTASYTAGQGGRDNDGARWAFDALYEIIVEEQPDLLD
ncbi:class II aldolase/adducin family protein [Frankia sp. AgPm24]|uniref:class II aldolase/adducin family protein n=1 Tax=Frankia sp. AgPm24 TaxID=631128 RepID=UPI0020108EE2|nr:class II aldolase/adducin family protein [Frankia sp. AgPm24]MCK9925100.1 class II aldolase/adducin family protein [Frankia sp. AgPm24]